MHFTESTFSSIANHVLYLLLSLTRCVIISGILLPVEILSWGNQRFSRKNSVRHLNPTWSLLQHQAMEKMVLCQYYRYVYVYHDNNNDNNKLETLC